MHTIVLAAAMLAVAGTTLEAQRTRDRDRDARSTRETSSDEWLDKCRDDRNGDDRERFCELREKTIPVARLVEVDGGQNGGASVRGWDRDEILVRAKIQTQADDAGEARDIAQQITIETTGGRIRAEGPSLKRRASWSVSFEVMVPRRTDLRLSAHNGGIAVEDVEGRMDLGTTNGGLNLRHVAGDVRGETTNGGVTVELDGDKWRGSGLDVRTTNGGVNLTIPRDFGARLETGTVNGSMNIDFPITVQGSIGRRITTQIGSGGPPIRAITTNGGVRIRQDK
jgi:DUF4097 and DUF4098 domain-containing protein YvlB